MENYAKQSARCGNLIMKYTVQNYARIRVSRHIYTRMVIRTRSHIVFAKKNRQIRTLKFVKCFAQLKRSADDGVPRQTREAEDIRFKNEFYHYAP